MLSERYLTDLSERDRGTFEKRNQEWGKFTETKGVEEWWGRYLTVAKTVSSMLLPGNERTGDKEGEMSHLEPTSTAEEMARRSRSW